MPPLLTANEVGKIINLSDHAVRVYCAKGKLPAIKIGNVWRIDSIKLLKSLDLFDQAEVIRIVEKQHEELLDARKRIAKESEKASTKKSVNQAIENFNWAGLIGE